MTVQRLFSKKFQIAWSVQKRCLTVGRRSHDLRPLTRDRSATFFKIFPNCLKRPKNVVWQSADGRVTSDHCRVTVQRLFSKFSQIDWNVQKTLFDSRPTVAWPPYHCRVTVQRLFSKTFKIAWNVQNVDRQSADGRVTSDHCRVTVQRLFFKKISNCLKRPKNVVWQSADGRVTSDHWRVTVQRLFSKFSQIAWNVQKTLFDSQPTVAWPPTTVAWPFSDFFQNFPKLLETSKKRCLTVGRRSRDLRPLSRDLSATFFETISNCLKRPKIVVWQSADSRVTSTTVAWPFSDFFKIFPNRLKRPRNVVWQSADGRVTSDHCRVTVQRLFSKKFLIAWNVQKTLFDSRLTVAWPPTSVAWPFSDFFQNFPKLLETSKKRCLTVGRRSRDLRPLSRDRSATFFKIFPNRLKRLKNVVWQSADGRVTSDHCRVTVQRLFWKKFLIAWNVQISLFDSRPTVAWPKSLSRDSSATFFKKISNCLKRPKNVVWQSADGRVTSDHWRVTVQRLFSKFSQIAWNVQKRCLTVGRRSRDLRPLSRDLSATFFKKISNCLKRPKIVVWQSADSRVTSTTVAWPFSDFFKIFPNRLKRPKNVVWQSADGRVTSDHCRVTVQRLFSKQFQIAWSVQKTLFDSRPTVAWPPTTVAWPFSNFFQNFPKLLETSKKRCLTVGRRSRDLRPLSRDRSATFFKKISNCLKRPNIVVWQSADSRVTSITVAWPFSDFFQKLLWLLETSKKRCLTVGRRSRDLRPLSRDRSATFFKKISNSLKRTKNVFWQSADGRVTSDHCRVTIQRLFFKIFPNCLKRPKTLFDSQPTGRLLSGDRSATFFKKISNCLERRKNVVWQSADSRVIPDHCHVTVQRLFFTNYSNCLIPRKTVVWQSADGDCPATLLPGLFRTASHTLAYGFFLVIPSSAKSKATYLLLQEWSDPGNFDIISKLEIGRRQFLILAGKFQLVDSPWGEQVPHYKHRRRKITYLLREIPMKNRERWDRSQQTGKLSG